MPPRQHTAAPSANVGDRCPVGCTCPQSYSTRRKDLIKVGDDPNCDKCHPPGQR